MLQEFENSFIEKNKQTKTPASLSNASLIMESGQFVPRYNQVLHPGSRDHPQVGHTPADIVSAHGQSKCCKQDIQVVKWRTKEEEVEKDPDQS